MLTIGRLLAGTAMLLAASAVCAQRTPVPIVDRLDLPVVTGSGKALDVEAVKRAIISGGAAGARKWEIAPAGGGNTLLGTYRVRTHIVVVEIVAEADAYSVKYANSVNMKYGNDRGTPVIHPFYNRWVDELLESIRSELRKL